MVAALGEPSKHENVPHLIRELHDTVLQGALPEMALIILVIVRVYPRFTIALQQWQTLTYTIEMVIFA